MATEPQDFETNPVDGPDPCEGDVLDEAKELTGGSRMTDYGHPYDDFKRTAALWSVYKGVDFDVKDVAVFMILVKTSRLAHRDKRDSWVDIAGYARCGHVAGVRERSLDKE